MQSGLLLSGCWESFLLVLGHCPLTFIDKYATMWADNYAYYSAIIPTKKGCGHLKRTFPQSVKPPCCSGVGTSSSGEPSALEKILLVNQDMFTFLKS